MGNSVSSDMGDVGGLFGSAGGSDVSTPRTSYRKLESHCSSLESALEAKQRALDELASQNTKLEAELAAGQANLYGLAQQMEQMSAMMAHERERLARRNLELEERLREDSGVLRAFRAAGRGVLDAIGDMASEEEEEDAARLQRGSSESGSDEAASPTTAPSSAAASPPASPAAAEPHLLFGSITSRFRNLSGENERLREQLEALTAQNQTLASQSAMLEAQLRSPMLARAVSRTEGGGAGGAGSRSPHEECANSVGTFQGIISHHEEGSDVDTMSMCSSIAPYHPDAPSEALFQRAVSNKEKFTRMKVQRNNLKSALATAQRQIEELRSLNYVE
mmetsp:Transcript_12460/g.41034  ORF Transcript_12460/g.41034 Transcript_12460/m.41034 type:complete len:335 (+) Transcript_12460:8-1012(+)